MRNISRKILAFAQHTDHTVFNEPQHNSPKEFKMKKTTGDINSDIAKFIKAGGKINKVSNSSPFCRDKIEQPAARKFRLSGSEWIRGIPFLGGGNDGGR